MPSLTRFHYTFTPSLRFALLTLFGVALFITLGVWQLHRAQAKEMILATQALFLKHAPILWQPGSSPPKQYERINVQGHYLPQQLLLDNQYHQHQLGYHVLSALMLENHRVIIVDRGWIPIKPSRTQLPHINIPHGLLNISGTTYYPAQNQWVLGQAIEVNDPDLAILEIIDPVLIRHFLHKSVYPFIIHLDADAPYGYTRAWIAVSMPPERHKAYAFQWFAIALTIFILFVALNIHKK